MPSFISNFKKRLRLPRMFFRHPTREEQVHGGPPLEFQRRSAVNLFFAGRSAEEHPRKAKSLFKIGNK